MQGTIEKTLAVIDEWEAMGAPVDPRSLDVRYETDAARPAAEEKAAEGAREGIRQWAERARATGEDQYGSGRFILGSVLSYMSWQRATDEQRERRLVMEERIREEMERRRQITGELRAIRDALGLKNEEMALLLRMPNTEAFENATNPAATYSTDRLARWLEEARVHAKVRGVMSPTTEEVGA